MTITWMPATMPIWVISCWAALITPSSSAATSLDADAAVDGVDRPLPTPGQGQGHQDHHQRRLGSELGEDQHRQPAGRRPPATVDSRSPTLTAA